MEIEVFTDESQIEDKTHNKEYIVIGSLFIPTSFKDELTKNLVNLRCLSSNEWFYDSDDCNHKCKYHDYNNFELHFKNIDNSLSKAKLEIYKNWIDFLVNNNKNAKNNDKMIYFEVLYIDLKNLDFDRFGVKKDKTNIYNRFYRTEIYNAIKFFFNKDNLIIRNFYHDKADNKEHHDYFPWHTSDKLSKLHNVEIINKEIKFIESNHKKCDKNLRNEAQLIQLIDLIIGCSNQILFKTSNINYKEDIASDFYPLFKRLWNNPNNPNSSFNYYRKQSISIFPKNIQIEEKNFSGSTVKIEGEFHRDLKIREPSSLKNETLDKYFN